MAVAASGGCADAYPAGGRLRPFTRGCADEARSPPGARDAVCGERVDARQLLAQLRLCDPELKDALALSQAGEEGASAAVKVG